MSKFCFTYGTNPAFPFQGGWTEIEAPDMSAAQNIFRAFHPDYREGILNCAFYYTEKAFKETEMYQSEDNLGAGCHEYIALVREVFSAESDGREKEKFIITCTTSHTSTDTNICTSMDGSIGPVELSVLIKNIIQTGREQFGLWFDIPLKEALAGEEIGVSNFLRCCQKEDHANED